MILTTIRKHTGRAEILGLLSALAILVTLALITGGCAGPSQATTGYIEWNIQPSTTPNPTATPQRPPSAPAAPRPPTQ